MTTQAQQVMSATVESSLFINPLNFNGCDVLKGMLAEGGALWLKAQEMHPDCKWDGIFGQIDFTDCSAIEFHRSFSSMYDTTYKAVA